MVCVAIMSGYAVTIGPLCNRAGNLPAVAWSPRPIEAGGPGNFGHVSETQTPSFDRRRERPIPLEPHRQSLLVRIPRIEVPIRVVNRNAADAGRAENVHSNIQCPLHPSDCFRSRISFTAFDSEDCFAEESLQSLRAQRLINGPTLR